MDSIERLAALFERFPGIGPRQASRFVHYLLRSSPSLRRELAQAVRELGGAVHQCPSCMRYHAGTDARCGICANPRRDTHVLAIVATDADLDALEKSGTYHGRYFVLGGTVSLGNERGAALHTKQLLASLPARIEEGLSEVVFAFPANPEGDATADQLRPMMENVSPSVRITQLGRGLSTGSELEYADPETLKSAFESRR